jgi:putative solute:sodium symporter small subunit
MGTKKDQASQWKENQRLYWKENLTYIIILLSIWFAVSYLFGIIFADALDTIHIGGFPLGFWFANQGSEVIFVILIAVYVKLMNHLDIKYDVHEQ